MNNIAEFICRKETLARIRRDLPDVPILQVTDTSEEYGPGTVMFAVDDALHNDRIVCYLCAGEI